MELSSTGYHQLLLTHFKSGMSEAKDFSDGKFSIVVCKKIGVKSVLMVPSAVS